MTDENAKMNPDNPSAYRPKNAEKPTPGAFYSEEHDCWFYPVFDMTDARRPNHLVEYGGVLMRRVNG